MKYFFDRMSNLKIDFVDISYLEVCDIEQFQTIINNISVIERLAEVKDQPPYNEFFRKRPVLKWLLNRAIYELALHKMKIVEKTIIDT